jgi:UDP-N-acetylmuramyl pentapeptide phosphotransferase/UDP-N-acetylglucosamine-1-phosphate transferase
MYGLHVTLGWSDIGVAAAFAAAISLCICVALVATRRWHGRFTNDAIGGVQKFHVVPTPRIGGVALALGYVLVVPALPEGLRAPWLLIGLAGSLPLLAGLGEDLTGRVGVRYRLLATMGGGVLTSMEITRK